MSNRFEYLRPGSVEEAVEMKAAHGARARFWAGGTDLMLLFHGRRTDFDFCIDLSYLPALRGIEETSVGTRIGSMATLDDIDAQSDLNPLMGCLGETVRLMCTKQTRTIATVGGNMCHGSPSADLAPPLVSMGSIARILGKEGEREVPLGEFHQGVNKTCLADDEVLTEIVVPKTNGRAVASYNRVARTVVDIALVSSAVFLESDDNGRISRAGVALGAVAPTVIRAEEAEQALVGCLVPEVANGRLEKAGDAAARAARAITDIRATKGFRTDMIDALTQRGLGKCVGSLEGEA